jgi:hypothetical protein
VRVNDEYFERRELRVAEMNYLEIYREEEEGWGVLEKVVNIPERF